MIDVLKNINPEDIEKHLSKIPTIIGEVKKKLPMLEAFEKSMILEHKLKDSTMFLYTMVRSKNNDKIMIYVFAGNVLEKETGSIPKGSLIIEKKIKAIDLFEFAEQISKDGINGIIDLLIL